MSAVVIAPAGQVLQAGLSFCQPNHHGAASPPFI